MKVLWVCERQMFYMCMADTSDTKTISAVRQGVSADGGARTCDTEKLSCPKVSSIVVTIIIRAWRMSLLALCAFVLNVYGGHL